MQKESKYGIDGMEPAVAHAARLVQACRGAGVPVLYTRQINRADGIGLPKGEVVDEHGAPTFYRSDTVNAEVLDELTPADGEVVIDKHRWSGFYGTSLDLVLRDLNVVNLLIGGFVTDGCVLTSLFDAYHRNYQVTMVEDICAATNVGSHRAAVAMSANWVYDIEILSAAQAIRKITGESYNAWTSTAPDQAQFTGATLDAVYTSIVEAGR